MLSPLRSSWSFCRPLKLEGTEMVPWGAWTWCCSHRICMTQGLLPPGGRFGLCTHPGAKHRILSIGSSTKYYSCQAETNHIWKAHLCRKAPLFTLLSFHISSSPVPNHGNLHTELCVACSWVGSSFWQFYEWVCLQCPVLSSSAQLLETHAYGFFYGVSLCHMWSSSFPAAFYFSSIIVLSKEPCLLMMCPKLDSFSLVITKRIFYLLILEREKGKGGRERNINLLFHLLFFHTHQRTCSLTLERRDGREKGGREISMGERNINQLPLIHTLTRDRTCNLGMCLDWESKPRPSSLWDRAPTN